MNTEKDNKMNMETKKKIIENEYVQSALTIGISMIFVVILMVSLDKIMGKPKVETKFTSNLAEEYYYDGKYTDAIEEYTNMQKEDPWPEYIVKIAEISSMLGEYEASNGALKEAVLYRDSLMEENAETYKEKDKELMNDIIFTFFMNKEYEQAISLGKDYLSEVGPYKELVETMFTLYINYGQVESAKAILNQYPIREENASDLVSVAKMRMILGEYEEGFKLLTDAWHIDKNEVEIFDAITQVASYDKDFIMEKLTTVAEANPNEEVYELFIAKLHATSTETVDKAEEIIESISEENNNNINYDVIKSQIYMSLGKEKEAKKILNNIIEDEKYSYIGYHIMAWNYYEEAEFEEAFEYCKKSIVANKDYADNFGFLIPEIMKSWGQTQAVEAYYRTALAVEPFNHAMMIKIADYYAFTTSQYEKAKEYYNLALSLKPYEDTIYYQLGMLALVEEDSEVALENLLEAIELNDKIGKYHRTIGNIYLSQDNNEMAIESYRNAYLLDESDILALNNAGCYYISVEESIFRGFENLEAAYEEMPEDLDSESKKHIIENYNKAKKIFDDYNEGDGALITVPEFHLFY